MKKKAHLIGALFFGILALILYKILTIGSLVSVPSLSEILQSIRISMFFSMIIFSMFGGVLPDMLDPPFTRYHRSFAHSRTLFYILSIFWLVTLLLLLKNFNLVTSFLYFFLTGYLSHLILDAV